jgi:hypothetical protein
MYRPVAIGWRTSVAALLLVLIVLAAPVVGKQPTATPELGCPTPAGSPEAAQATPEQQEPATPETGTADPAVGGQIVDTASLVDALESCGLDVQPTRGVEQPFLQPESGTGLRISGGKISQPADVQVFEYADEASATADAAQIGPDGNPTTMMILWIEPPHFFRGEQIIVLYIGEDQAVIDVLTSVLDPPFAGG